MVVSDLEILVDYQWMMRYQQCFGLSELLSELWQRQGGPAECGICLEIVHQDFMVIFWI